MLGRTCIHFGESLCEGVFTYDYLSLGKVWKGILQTINMVTSGDKKNRTTTPGHSFSSFVHFKLPE